ncbi:MAG: LruC domain-containing protein [Bacteroidota bacterium]|nr:LruC domain-containing protein [Bacteroidota bacterium]
MKKLLPLITLLLLVQSCLEKPVVELEETVNETTNFDFATTQEVAIDISLADASGNAFKGVKFSIFEVDGDTLGKQLFTAVTNASGAFRDNLSLPAYYESVYVQSAFVGIPGQIQVPIQNNLIEVVYAEGELKSAIIEKEEQSQGGTAANQSYSVNGITFSYMDNYSFWWGVPKNLEKKRDKISTDLLDIINSSLPEGQPVPDYHPTYLADGRKTTLDIVETADVWLTFVHEGAGWRNAIGFYTYPTSNPPSTLDDIDVINVAFPNLSYFGSGGKLRSGDKINLGRFEPGTSIGLVLLADGWNGWNSESYDYLVFADKDLNPESDPALRQHNVLLWDEENELFLLGFEDVNREYLWCDQDFNDAIMFVTSNPPTAISTTNVSPVDKPGTLDTDGDGINDVLDEFPNDANKAYSSYYPSSSTFGSFAFEDNWPNYGDYDFNDLVIDYQFKHILNADNKVVEMESKFKVRAIGAGYRNGFGFATKLLPGDVSSSTGQLINNANIKLNGNGTEQGQDNAVFIVTSSVHDLFSTSGFVNTEDGAQELEPQVLTIQTQLTNPKAYSEIGTAPYNPFLIIGQDRGREVHLPGYEPTNLVNSEYFGTLDDNSDPDAGVYYRSKTDLPWAIHLPESFDYPTEKIDIREGHLRFRDWAQSYGYSYMDWYKERDGYRNRRKLFKK